ncbi:uncharacterized protein [Physcomitrium patens]|uniref:uncharacterized protein n=1 Tax=Physcomitrium patens TaxID=3218 RepID=UPI0001622044
MHPNEVFKKPPQTETLEDNLYLEELCRSVNGGQDRIHANSNSAMAVARASRERSRVAATSFRLRRFVFDVMVRSLVIEVNRGAERGVVVTCQSFAVDGKTVEPYGIADKRKVGVGRMIDERD